MNGFTVQHRFHTSTLCRVGGLAALAVFTFASTSSAQTTGSATTPAKVSQPYLVFVASEATHLRCGPSGEYYKTDSVRHGQELEVYVETADGWLGVRPVDESFCWVPADAVELKQTQSNGRASRGEVLGVATVTEDKTVAWIGTNLGRARRYRWQVQLGEGEQVTIVGSSERDGPDGPQTWYRIVPPSGEFRWVHRDQTVDTAEALVASLKQPQASDKPFLPAQKERVQPTQYPTPAQVASATRSQFEADVADENWDLDTDSIRADANRSNERSPERSHPRRDLAERVASWTKVYDDGENIDVDRPRSFNETRESTATSDVHHPMSLSHRIVKSIGSLVSGGDEPVELEPMTRSSRRVPELVPIEGDRVQIARAATSPSSGIAPTNREPTTEGDASKLSTPIAVGSGVASTPSITPPANRESTLNIASRPRMMDGITTSPVSSPTPAIQVVSHAMPLAPRNQRIVPAAQMEQVQREVSRADVATLPVLFSKLMARGASAPETALIAEAAERMQLHALASRCREYQIIARRRDGETVVETLGLATPVTPVPTFVDVAPIHSVVETGSQVDPPAAVVPTAASTATAVHQGKLVEVYSADPSRPPYAITDAGGRTVAYLTPAPGVEVHSHLGGTIAVQGESGYLKGIDTPHVMATSVTRVGR